MSKASPNLKRKITDETENDATINKKKKSEVKLKANKQVDSPKVKGKVKSPKVKGKVDSPKVDSKSTGQPLNQIQNNLKQQKLSFYKVPKDDGKWEIQNFLFDKEWKELLADEFEQEYFKTISEKIKEGYRKDIVRPPKELVFNALNSTKLSDVC